MLLDIILIFVCIIVGILFLFFLIAGFMHYKLFGKRWEPDGIVKYYEQNEFAGFEAAEFVVNIKDEYLRGYCYYYANLDYKGVIVFAHGMWGSHKAYLQEIEALAKAGYRVYAYDNYGTELSDGKNILGLGSSVRCLDVVLKYLKQIYKADEIAVMGHSWGGFAAASIAKYHPDLKMVISMSGFVSIRRVLKSILPKKLYFLIPYFILIDFFKCGKYSLANTKKILSKTQIKTLIIHSLDDNLVKFKYNAGFLQKKITNPNINYLIVDGKKHNPDYSSKAIEYTTQVLNKLHSLTKEEAQEFRKDINYHLMGELDNVIMEKILAFLNN